jgi:hypothetical protein
MTIASTYKKVTFYASISSCLIAEGHKSMSERLRGFRGVSQVSPGTGWKESYYNLYPYVPPKLQVSVYSVIMYVANDNQVKTSTTKIVLGEMDNAVGEQKNKLRAGSLVCFHYDPKDAFL